jgi:IS1 family transposase
MTQRKHRMLRTCSTRLVRKMIGFAASAEMHDIAMGVCVKRYELWLRL